MEIGAHVSSAGGIHTAIDRAVAIGADSMQVFTQSPRTWRPTNHDPASFDLFREKRAKADMGGVLFHVGSHLGSGFEHGLERVVPAMRQVLELATGDTWLLMENSAGAGGTIGRSVAELATLYERLDRHPRLGICLDSCHLYVSGVDVTDQAALDACLD